MNGPQTTPSPTDTQSNGVVPNATDAVLAASLRDIVEGKSREMVELSDRLDVLRGELSRYSRALALLTGEPAATRGPHKQSKATGTTRTGVSEERLAAITDIVRRLGANDREFRQIDVRQHTSLGSGVVAAAFARLRDRRVIRFSRQDGNSKWYRLDVEGER
jgi:DNA-binding transcriptional ArsR family regulator